MELDGLGAVESWYEVIDVSLPLVSFRGTVHFSSDGTRLTSDSTLRFRTQDEFAGSLHATGFRIDDVREAPDRPVQVRRQGHRAALVGGVLTTSPFVRSDRACGG